MPSPKKAADMLCADKEPTVSRTARAPDEERAPPINGIDAFFKAHD
jgi:hypothetical protein